MMPTLYAENPTGYGSKGRSNDNNSRSVAPLPDRILQEFRASGIPDRLTVLNIEYLQGREALETFNPPEFTSEGHNFGRGRDRHRKWARSDQGLAIQGGGWLATGVMISGCPDPVPYFKPDTPRIDFEKGWKRVKYETPAGEQALPILPCVSWEFGLKIAKKHGVGKAYEARILQERFSAKATIGDGLDCDRSLDGARDGRGGSGQGFSGGEAGRSGNRDALAKWQHFILDYDGEFDWGNQLDSGFWAFIKSQKVQITITEGLKKALSLIAHGYPAIALRGITQWHKKGSNELHDVIAYFATDKRRFAICFDQDSKESTRRNVRREILKLGNALSDLKCPVTVMLWDGKIGKGIDDAIVAEGQDWLDTQVDDAIALATYKRDSRIAQAFERLARLNTLSYPIDRATEGEYLPELPPLTQGAIHVLSANQNAGKTTRIGADWVKQSPWLKIVLSPTNATGQQTAHDWGLPHIHNYATDRLSQQALWADVVHSGGIVLCGESLHRLPDWMFDRPVLLILDEANQIIEGLTQGDTLGSRYSQILEKFTALSQHAIATGAIVLSEDGLPDRPVKFTEKLSGAATVRVFTHRKQSAPWNCVVYRGQASGYRAKFLAAVASGKRLIYVASSQREAKRIERAIGRLNLSLKVIRIDSETNQGGRFTEFFEQPDPWLYREQPDVLILSPSAKSGVSIEGAVSAENAYFAEVWGYFPALGTDTHSQQLGRYRPPVPRFIFCPDFILGSGDESLLTPRAIRRRLGLNAKAIAGVYGLADLLEPGEAETKLLIQSAVLEYLAAAKAAIGNQKLIAHESLVQRLRANGHNVTIDIAQKGKAVVTQWDEIKKEIWWEEAHAIAAAPITEIHTIDWARKTLDSLDVGIETRTIAHKVIWRSEFPGMLFDDPAECYAGLTRDYGAMARGVKLQATAENLDGAKLDDRALVKSILSGNIQAAHRLPKSYVQAMLISQSGVLALLDGKEYSVADPRCQRVKAWAVRYANEIAYWFGLHIKSTQSPIEICHKLLKRMGLDRDKPDRPGAIKTIGRRGHRGNNPEFFRIDLDFCPIRARLLQSAQDRLFAQVSSISNSDFNLLEIDETPPQEFGVGVREPEVIAPVLDRYGYPLNDFGGIAA